MDLLRGNFLMNTKEEAVIANEVMRDADCVCLYFSATWCPPCQSFVPRLKALLEAARSRGIVLEIIFVPSDRDNQEMARSFAENHGPWYAVPVVGELPVALRRKMKIYSIPQLVVMGPNGKVLSKTGREEVEGCEDPLALWLPELTEQAAEGTEA